MDYQHINVTRKYNLKQKMHHPKKGERKGS